MKKSFILSLLLGLAFLPSLLWAHPVSVEDEAALLAARGDVFRLRPLYDSISQRLTPHTDLYCRFAFSRAAGDHRRVIELIDSLERHHERKLDVRGLLALAGERCAALLSLGEYAALSDYCDERLAWARRRSIRQSRRKELKAYQSIAVAFASHPPMQVEWTSDAFVLPLTRDWPLLLPVAVNDKEAQPFLIDTGHRHTLISAADAAEWGVSPLSATLRLSTARGWTEARPGLIERLNIGGLTLRNLMVFVVADDLEAPYNRSLGTHVLQQLHTLTFADTDLSVERRSASFPSDTLGVSLAFSLDGGLCLQPADTTADPLPFNLALPDTIASSSCFGALQLRRADRTMLDFSTLRLHRSAPRDYVPFTVDRYLSHSDYFGLLRNEASLLFTSSPEEVAQMTATLNRCLEPRLSLSLPHGLPSTLPPLEVLSPDSAVFVPYLDGGGRQVATLLAGRSLPAEVTPLHPLSQIPLSIVRRFSLPVHKDGQGRQWAQIDHLLLGDVEVKHLLCLVHALPTETLTLGLDVLTRLPAVGFGSDGLTFHAASDTASVGYVRPYLLTPSGAVVEISPSFSSASSSRQLKPADFMGKTIDFARMFIR